MIKVNVIFTLCAVMLISCDPQDEFIRAAEQDKNQILDLRSDLSNLNFEEFVIQQKDFGMQVNDSLLIQFEAIEVPIVDDPEEDVVYTTANERGSITFSKEGTMHFIYNDEKRAIRGSLYNTPALEAKARKELITSLYSEAASLKNHEENRMLLERKGGNELIEYFSNVQSNKLQKSGTNKLSINQSNECATDQSTEIQKRSIQLNDLSNDGVIRFRVYTLKKLSDRAICYAKIHTRNSLKDAYDDNSTFRSRVKTYFGKAEGGNKIVDFIGDKTTTSSFLASWLSYVSENFDTEYDTSDNKFLLLTDFEVDGALGRAKVGNKSGTGGRVGWGLISGNSYSTPGHEAGHMFGAAHTEIKLERVGWSWIKLFTADIMCQDRGDYYVLENNDGHDDADNRETIKAHIMNSTSN